MAITHLLLSLIAKCWLFSLRDITILMIRVHWEDMLGEVLDFSWLRQNNLESSIDHHQDSNNSLLTTKMSFRESSHHRLWLSRPLKSHTQHSCRPSKTQGPIKVEELLPLTSFKNNSEWLKSNQKQQQWRELSLREVDAQNAHWSLHASTMIVWKLSTLNHHSRPLKEGYSILRKRTVKSQARLPPSLSSDPTAFQSTHTSKLVAESAFLKWVALRALWTMPRPEQVSSKTMGSRYYRTSRIISHQFLSQHPQTIVLCKKQRSWARFLPSRMRWRRCWWPNLTSQTHLKNLRILRSNKLPT